MDESLFLDITYRCLFFLNSTGDSGDNFDVTNWLSVTVSNPNFNCFVPLISPIKDCVSLTTAVIFALLNPPKMKLYSLKVGTVCELVTKLVDE